MVENIEAQPEEIIKEQRKSSCLDKIKVHKFKILAGVLGVLVLVGAIFGAYQLGRIQYAKEQTRQIAEQEELTRCNQDSDCVFAIRLDVCCSCPRAISRQVLQRDKKWVEYEFGKDYSQEKQKSCQGVQCKPCSSPSEKAVCFSGKCQFSPEGQFCGGIAGVECPKGYRCQLEGDYPDAGGKCVRE